MPVISEKEEPVTTVTLSRPGVRNAVDREAAQELADAFRMFAQDAEACVAVFVGDQGMFSDDAD
jgi:enoyl-CoA hydratase